MKKRDSGWLDQKQRLSTLFTDFQTQYLILKLSCNQFLLQWWDLENSHKNQITNTLLIRHNTILYVKMGIRTAKRPRIHLYFICFHLFMDRIAKLLSEIYIFFPLCTMLSLICFRRYLRKEELDLLDIEFSSPNS